MKDKEIFFQVHEYSELLKEIHKELSDSTYVSGDVYADSENERVLSSSLWKKLEKAVKEMN